jgi:hypothetical protein
MDESVLRDLLTDNAELHHRGMGMLRNDYNYNYARTLQWDDYLHAMTYTSRLLFVYKELPKYFPDRVQECRYMMRTILRTYFMNVIARLGTMTYEEFEYMTRYNDLLRMSMGMVIHFDQDRNPRISAFESQMGNIEDEEEEEEEEYNVLYGAMSVCSFTDAANAD